MSVSYTHLDVYKRQYRINDNQEILAFAMGNLAAALTGCFPIHGSVSRTAMGEQYQAKTQLTGIVAGLSMIVLLLGGKMCIRDRKNTVWKI